MTTTTPLTIRLAHTADAVALGNLAQIDSRSVPAAPVLVAETGGDLLAALSLVDGASVADPFRPTADVVALLRARAARGALDGAQDAGAHVGGPVPARTAASAQALMSAH